MPDKQNKGVVNYLITLKQFFEDIHPGKKVRVKDLSVYKQGQYSGFHEIQLPVIELHCKTETCEGVRFFEPVSTLQIVPGETANHFAIYVCRNCVRETKTYAFSINREKNENNGELIKLGENPLFGPPTPARLISMLGGERECYLKGRRAEMQGLGIAAFAYYRRVVENQKNKILDEIVRVARQLNASSEIISELESARNETQFTKALEMVKHGLPQILMINSHNPLTLLHSALSEGIHGKTDEECLETATSIRVILTELVDRLTSALKEKAELNAAVSKLFKEKK